MRAAKRRSSRRRSSRRLRRNDAPPVAAVVTAPSSKKKKLLVLGVGVVVVGGVAAYAMSASASAPPLLTGPTGPTVDPRVAKAAECAALQASLVQLRSLPTPDRASMTRLEGQIAACMAQARELGVPIDPATDHRASADASRAQIDAWFNEYKATSDHDPLKRNNTRQSILTGGGALATAYAEAIVQSPNNETTKLIAQSIIAALDAAITRKLCFLGNERGCGTFASNEDQPDTKAGQEQERVITPLVTAYMQAVAKVGGPSQALARADGEKFLAAMLRPCVFLKTYIDGQFAHYRATEWSDALRRNNTRRDILADGRTLTACLQQVFTSASSFGSTAKLREVGTLTVAALNSSIDRWKCFFTGGSGCGTFAVNEDQPDAKAAQEMANTAVPLMALYAQIARALVARGDLRAFEPLVTAKLSACSAMKDYIEGQFAHYKATDYSDAVKRNNTRQSMLATGAALAACLQDALATAVSAKTAAVPLRGTSGLGLLGLGGYTGLGQTPTAPFMMMMPMTATAIRLPLPTPRVDIGPMVRAVAAVATPALNNAVTRKLCYLSDQPGCGRFALNEDHGNDKAAHEQSRVINPLIVLFKNTVAADGTNAQVEVPLMKILLREIEARRDYLNAKFAELHSVPYHDPLRRNNVRDALIASARDMIAGYRNARPTTAAGRTAVRTSAQVALQKSKEREACYRAGASGCDRFGWSEPTGGEKADQELAEVTNPMLGLLADRSAAGLAGLGDSDETTMGLALLGLGIVGMVVFGGVYRPKSKSVRRNKRRTSRRVSA
jgi:hypothetical protein